MERTKEQKLDFIRVNHYYMTIGEMAKELNMLYSVVSRFCNQLGVVPITEKEQEQEKAAAARKKRKRLPVKPDEELELLEIAALLFEGVSPAAKKKLQNFISP